MIEYIYFVIIVLFIIGGILISIINRNRDREFRKKNWIKFAGYLIIVNLVIGSIIYNQRLFYYVTAAISFLGLVEIIKAVYSSRKIFTGIITLLLFLPLAIAFVEFARLKQNVLLFTYLVVIIFDAFSQLTGQLFGKTKLVPGISPNKTLEGFTGGIISTSIISGLFSGLLEFPVVKTVVLSLIISLSAFCGDLLASYCKRRFGIKDFSKILPGQGGILDRFDSFIFSGVIILVLNYYKLI